MMQRFRRRLTWLVAFALPCPAESQMLAANPLQTEQATSGAVQNPTVLKVTTREVIVDVLASDRHDHSILNLQAADLAVFEISPDHKKNQQRITSIRYLEPLSDKPQSSSFGNLHVKLGSGCAEETTAHYEVTYHVNTDELRDGGHNILITASRSGVKLNYGSHYYVAGIAKLAEAANEPTRAAEAALLQAACFHSSIPLSLPLFAHPVEGPDSSGLRFQIVIPPAALALASISVQSRDIKLEYGACDFDQNGRPLHFFRASEERHLRSGEYAQAAIHGFPSFLGLPAAEHPAAIRFVVKDRQTGNMGAVLISSSNGLKAGQLTPDEAQAEQHWKEHQASRFSGTNDNFPPLGPIGSFGTIEPRAGAMCGDVYELAAGTARLPNFWSLDSVGSLYAYVLDVPHQQFWKSGGLPGVSRATEWFGIDYHGAFQVTVPGLYEFTILADDGAKLYIDDHLVLDADSIHNVQTVSAKVTLQSGPHTLHLPYFQGPPNSVALQLFVKKPGGPREFFDTREFGAARDTGISLDAASER